MTDPCTDLWFRDVCSGRGVRVVLRAAFPQSLRRARTRWPSCGRARRFLAALALVGAAMTAVPLHATAGDPDPAQALAPAVARVNHAGYRDKRHCTGFAIADDVAITAAHCLRGIDPRGMHVLFGYARMSWDAHVSPERAATLGNDVAVLCLADDAPVHLPTADSPPERGASVRVLGYGRPRVHALSQAQCRVSAIVDDALLLDCPQSPGASGGPVIDEAGAAVAVMSRTARASSTASLLPPDAAANCP